MAHQLEFGEIDMWLELFVFVEQILYVTAIRLEPFDLFHLCLNQPLVLIFGQLSASIFHESMNKLIILIV